MRIAALFSCFFLFSLVQAQEEEVNHVSIKDIDYSIVKLEVDKPAQGLDPFYDSCKNAQVVYTGENHIYTPFNNLISLTILKELNSRYGFRDHIIELGPARSQLINAFLLGDSFATLKLKASTSYSHFVFYEWLKEWNDALADKEKIRVHGIDVERFNEIPLMNIGEMFEKTESEVPQSIQALRSTAIYRFHRLMESGLEYFDKPDESYYGAYEVSSSSVRQMIHTSDSLKEDLKLFFGESYSFYKEQIDYLKEYATFKEYRNTPMEHNWRETNMFLRLNRLIKNNPKRKFYGQFGRCHSLRNTEGPECNWYAFRSTLERVSSIEGGIKTVSMGMFYGKNYPFYDDTYNDLLESAPAGKISMFNLKPYGERTDISDQFDFALVNDEMLKRKVSRTEGKSSNRSKSDFSYNTFSAGFEYWPWVSQSGVEDIFALDTLDFPVNNLWHLGFFGRVKFTNNFTSELGYSWAIGNIKSSNSRMSLSYAAKAIRYNVGYALLDREKIMLDVHLGAMYTVQKLNAEFRPDSAFGGNTLSKFKKQDVLGSAGINVQFRIFPSSYLGFSCDYTQPLGLGKQGWSLNGSAPEKNFGNPTIKSSYANPIAAQIKWGFYL